MISNCYVLSAFKACPCGGDYKRPQHPTFKITHPVCSECEETPRLYRMRKNIDGRNLEFRYNAKGRNIRSVDEAVRLSRDIDIEITQGTFNNENYRSKREKICTISDTLGDFIEQYVFKKVRLDLEDKMYLEDFMAPFFSEVGIFVASQIHLMDFIKTFRLKGEEKERAVRLFNLVVKEIRL